MKITEKIDKYLDENGISRRQFSAIAGVPYTTLVGLYKDSNARLSTLRALANAMRVTLDYLCDDSVEVYVAGKADEAELIRLYDNAEPRIRKAIDALLKREE